jgi:hypothetical protein
MVYRAICFAGSRHLIVRLRAKDARSSVLRETLLPALTNTVGNNGFRYLTHESMITLFTGSEIRIRGCLRFPKESLGFFQPLTLIGMISGLIRLDGISSGILKTRLFSGRIASNEQYLINPIYETAIMQDALKNP